MLLAAILLTGLVTVTDGDTIKLQDETVRLRGIDAPEGRQYCHQGRMAVLCGQIAAARLRDLAGGKVVTCKGKKRDRYRRLIAKCSVDRLDLGEMMVGEGWALAYRRYSQDYTDEEASARKSGKGLWAMEFQAPWAWRHR